MWILFILYVGIKLENPSMLWDFYLLKEPHNWPLKYIISQCLSFAGAAAEAIYLVRKEVIQPMCDCILFFFWFHISHKQQ